MKPVKLYLISPREPCGATWLINCLLVLNIKTYRMTVGQDMWVKSGNFWKLSPAENLLKKWLPVLSDIENFSFNKEIEIEWAHKWPTNKTAGAKIIYFIRDPRDALLSRYKRESPDVTFQEFLDFPDTRSLLDKLDTWNLFNEAWLSQPDLKVIRFEDYKEDAAQTLRAVLSFANIDATDSEQSDAIKRSSFDQAARAEKLYREANPEDTQVINRASQIGSWRDPELSVEATKIEERCGLIMARFGYLSEKTQDFQQCSYLPHAGVLKFYRNLNVPVQFWRRNKDGRETVRESSTLSLISNISANQLTRLNLLPFERLQLLMGAREFLKNFYTRSSRQLLNVKRNSSGNPGLLWRLNESLEYRGMQIPLSIKTIVWKSVRFFRPVVIKRPR